MPRIGIIGLGFMGRMHYDTYGKIPGAEVVAIAPGSVLVDATTCWAVGQPSFGAILAVQGFHAAELAPLLAPRHQGMPSSP